MNDSAGVFLGEFEEVGDVAVGAGAVHPHAQCEERERGGHPAPHEPHHHHQHGRNVRAQRVQDLPCLVNLDPEPGSYSKHSCKMATFMLLYRSPHTLPL